MGATAAHERFPNGGDSGGSDVIGLPNAGIQVFVATVPAGSVPGSIYTQSLVAHDVRTRSPVQTLPDGEFVYWAWSDWKRMQT